MEPRHFSGGPCRGSAEKKLEGRHRFALDLIERQKGAHRFRETGERDPTFGCLRRIGDAALELEHPALHLGEAGAGDGAELAIGAKAFCDEAGPTVSSFYLPDKDLTHLREVLSQACQEVADGVERLRIGGAAPKHLNETAQAVEIARGRRRKVVNLLPWR